MSIIFFDTETTGLPQKSLPRDHVAQPHLVQLAALLTDDDLNEIAHCNLIIKPNGYEIPVEASSVHGITTERAHEFGVPERWATAIFFAMARSAHTMVAHNIEFDAELVRLAAIRHGLPDAQTLFQGKTLYCTAEKSRSVVKCPPTEKMLRAGFTNYKMPKLQEAYVHFFHEEFEGAHDALADVRACARIFKALHAPVSAG